MIKLSILNDGDKYAYMEYQGGNDPKEFNGVYGTGGFWDLEDLFKSLLETYADEEIVITNNLKKNYDT